VGSGEERKRGQTRNIGGTSFVESSRSWSRAGNLLPQPFSGKQPHTVSRNKTDLRNPKTTDKSDGWPTALKIFPAKRGKTSNRGTVHLSKILRDISKEKRGENCPRNSFNTISGKPVNHFENEKQKEKGGREWYPTRTASLVVAVEYISQKSLPRRGTVTFTIGQQRTLKFA